MSITRPVTHVSLALIAAIAIAIAVAALATPARAGGVCSLQATVGGGSATEVEVGEEVLVEGFGFPPGDVEVSFSSDGTFLRSVTATADATGFFELTEVPLAGEEGLWSVDAVGIDEICTATTGFLVVEGPTPAPTASPTAVPTPAPSASTIPNVAVPSPSPAALPGGLILLGVGLLFLAAATLRLASARRRR